MATRRTTRRRHGGGDGGTVSTAGLLTLGALAGTAAASYAAVPASFGAVLGALAVYLLSCWRWPYARCWWCRGRSTRRGDGAGHYRRARPCRVCGGEDHVRLGARLLGRG